MGWQAVGLAVTIVIRAYNNAGVPAADLAAAKAHTEAVLQEAGLNIVWADCWSGDRSRLADEATRCQEPVGGDIVLRLQKTKHTDRSKFVSMGFSLVKTEGATPFLSTVYVDRADSVARVAGTDPRRVLGLAIAHEIGHVLLNSNTHADSGLMRADWSRNELRKQEKAAWYFTEAEAAHVRAAAMERQAGHAAITLSAVRSNRCAMSAPC
jgi:hypothetical protein